MTQLMNYESILFINLDRTFQKQFLFYDKNSISYEGFDLEKGLKMQEFRLNFFKYFFLVQFLIFGFQES